MMGLTMMISFKEDNKEFEKNESTKRNMLWGIVAVFSHSKANELFYILKVIWKGIATENIADANNHTVRKGESYVIGLYLQKLDEKKRSITNFWMIKVFALTGQIFYPYVLIYTGWPPVEN